MALAHRHLILASLALLPLATVLLRAQAPAAVEPVPQFRVVAMANAETFFFDVDKKKEQLNACVGSFSRLYPAPKNREVVFYAEVPNAAPGLPPSKVPLSKTVLPARNPGPFLIVLSQNPTGADLKFTTLVIDNSLEAYPANTYRVFNFSKRRLAVRLADKNLVLVPGQSEQVPYPDTRKAWLQVAANEDDGNWLLVSSSPQPVGANSRTTVFLLDIAPSELDPAPKGIISRRMKETITTDDKGVRHVQ